MMHIENTITNSKPYPWLNEYTNCGMSNGVAANVGVKSKSGTNSDCDWS